MYATQVIASFGGQPLVTSDILDHIQLLQTLAVMEKLVDLAYLIMYQFPIWKIPAFRHYGSDFGR